MPHDTGARGAPRVKPIAWLSPVHPRSALTKPARKVVTRSRTRTRGLFPSRRGNVVVEWESTIERDYCLVLEADPSVAAFYSQPERVYLEGPEGRRRAYPDFRVTFRSGDSQISEVKPDSEIELPENQAVFKLLSAHYAALGETYVVVPQSVIRQQPRLDNAGLLFRYRDCAFPEAIRRQVRERLRHAPVTLDRLARELEQPERELLALLLKMHFEREVWFDLNQPLNGALQLWESDSAGGAE